MTSLARLAVTGAAIAVTGGLAWYGYGRVYAGPRDELLDRLGAASGGESRYEGEIEARQAMARELREYGLRSLGATEDVVQHRLRTRLNELALACGLQDVVVSNGRPRPEGNPARREVKGSFARMLKTSPDFMSMKGDLRGVGPLDKVLLTLATVEAQPWVGSIEWYSLKPQGKERTEFEVRIGVVTAYLPDLVPENHPGPEPVAVGTTEAERWAGIVQRNVFRRPDPIASPPPPPPPPPVDAIPAPPPPPPPPPYGEWRMTGVVESRRGLEVWFTNTRTKEQQVVGLGDRLLDATCVGGNGEWARFEINGTQFEIRTGQSLAERRDVEHPSGNPPQFSEGS